jgi:SAM-dependent methyltransferase
MALDQHKMKPHDRYKASSFRAYNEKLPGKYDTSIAVRFFRPSTMDDFVMDALGQDVAASAILDVGCATGRLLERLAEAGARKLAGCDLAPRILDAARGKLARFDVVSDLRSADAETSLPWPAETFDVVVLTGVVHHFCNPQDALREIGRVLRPGGKLIIADACFFPPVRELFNLCLRVHPHKGDCYFHTGRHLRQTLSAGGWEVSRCERLNWWFFGIVARRASSGAALANERIQTDGPSIRR